MTGNNEKNTDTVFHFPRITRKDLKSLLYLVGPPLFIIIGGLNFHEFVWNAVASNPAINFGIIGTAAIGVVLIVIRMLDAMQDFHILMRFRDEAFQGAYMKTLLEQPWIRHRYIRHYLAHIASTGGIMSSSLEHSSIEGELEALEVDYNSRLEFPQFLVGFMIAMGLLGTFIGLLETLTGIAGMLDGMGGDGVDVSKQFTKLVVELRKPLNGMGIAFSASMFGLITSLMLAVMMTTVRRYIAQVISLARNVMHDLVEVFAKDDSEGKSLSPEDVTAALINDKSFKPRPDGGGNSPSGIAQIAGHFDVLARKIENLLTAVESNTVSTKKLQDLIGFGPRMKELNELMLDEMKKGSATSSEQARIMQGILTSNAESGQMLASMLEAQKYAAGDLSLQIKELATQSSRDVQENSLEEMRNLVAGTIENQRMMQSMLAIHGTMLQSMQAMAESQKQSTTDIVDQMRRLLEQVVSLREVETRSGVHLFELKQVGAKLTNAASMIDLIASNSGAHTVLLEKVVFEAHDTQNAIQSLHGTILQRADQ